MCGRCGLAEKRPCHRPLTPALYSAQRPRASVIFAGFRGRSAHGSRHSFRFRLLLTSRYVLLRARRDGLRDRHGGWWRCNLPATATPLSLPNGLWIDRDGGLWVADMGNHVIRRMDPVTAVMRVVVGGGTIVDDAVPAPAGSVQLSLPSHLVGDAAGNVYFTDSAASRSCCPRKLGFCSSEWKDAW